MFEIISWICVTPELWITEKCGKHLQCNRWLQSEYTDEQDSKQDRVCRMEVSTLITENGNFSIANTVIIPTTVYHYEEDKKVSGQETEEACLVHLYLHMCTHIHTSSTLSASIYTPPRMH